MAQHDDGTPYRVLLVDDDADVGRYQDDAILTPIGQFFGLEAAIAAVMPDVAPG